MIKVYCNHTALNRLRFRYKIHNKLCYPGQGGGGGSGCSVLRTLGTRREHTIHGTTIDTHIRIWGEHAQKLRADRAQDWSGDTLIEVRVYY